tara:strand:- start:33 stop:533 length:501 start_codon:yes stop_codon:yes gene_type:complete
MNWAQTLGPSLAQAAQARVEALRQEKLLEEQQEMATGQAIGQGAGALIGAFTPVGPVIGASLGSVVGNQAARVAQGRGPGFDDTASGVQAATQTAIGVAGANRAINQQASQDKYASYLGEMIQPGNEDMLTAYQAMPRAQQLQFEKGDTDIFDSWFGSNAWMKPSV